MDPSAYLSSITEDASRLAGAARAGLDQSVPTCPGWTLGKLVLHVGLVHRWSTEVVRSQASEPLDFSVAGQAPEGPARVDWFEEGAGALVSVLSQTDPTTEMWTFAGSPGTARFWYRRQAQETSIHRWDAEAAHGSATPIDPALAADGIDELVDVLAPGVAGSFPEQGLGGTLHLHCTDTDGEWLVGLRPGRLEVARQHAKADAALRGTASDLSLFLWGRLPPSALELFGDPEVAGRWASLVRL